MLLFCCKLILGTWDDQGVVDQVEVLSTSSLQHRAETMGYKGISTEDVLNQGMGQISGIYIYMCTTQIKYHLCLYAYPFTLVTMLTYLSLSD